MSSVVDPCELRFSLLAARRYILDNELTLSELVPGAVLRPSLQHPLMPCCTVPPSVSFENGELIFSEEKGAAAEGGLFVGAFFPGIHFSVDVEDLSPGAAVLMDITQPDGSFRLRLRAEAGKPSGLKRV